MLVERLDQTICNLRKIVYTVEHSVMALRMIGRKPAWVSATLAKDNNDLTNTYAGIIFWSYSLWYNETLWKQLSTNSAADE